MPYSTEVLRRRSVTIVVTCQNDDCDFEKHGHWSNLPVPAPKVNGQHHQAKRGADQNAAALAHVRNTGHTVISRRMVHTTIVPS